MPTGLCPIDVAFYLKVFGFACQLIGAFIVFNFLLLKIRQHGISIRNWIPFMPKDSSPIPLDISIMEIEVLEPRVAPVPPKTLEEMPAFIQGEIEWVTSNLERDFNRRLESLKKKQFEFEDATRRSLEELRSKINVRDSDVQDEILGWFMVTLGMTLTTFPDEIAKMIY